MNVSKLPCRGKKEEEEDSALLNASLAPFFKRGGIQKATKVIKEAEETRLETRERARGNRFPLPHNLRTTTYIVHTVCTYRDGEALNYSQYIFGDEE